MDTILSQYQWGRTALHEAARGGHTAVASLLLDEGTPLNLTDEVSEMTREILVIVCVSVCIIMTCYISVIAKSTNHRNYKHGHECNFDNSQVCMIVYIVCLHI